MSTQNEGKDIKGNSDHQRMPEGAESAGNIGTGETGASGQPALSEGSQQAEMPPSETDDDQYDQGTVQRAP